MDEHLLRFKKDVKFALIDVETFNLGLNFQTNRPWQIAVIMAQGDFIVRELDVMIKWDDCKFSIGSEAAKITRFNQQAFDAAAISPEDAFKQFWPMLQEADYVVMHNGLRFDIYLLKGFAECMKADWSFLLPKVIDTRAIAQGIKLGRPYQPKEDVLIDYMYRMASDRTKGVKTSLTTLGKEYGIEHDYENLHNALCDLQLNLKVWNKIKHQTEL